MLGITTVGLDLAKTVFQAHRVDPSGRAILQEAETRSGAGILSLTTRTFPFPLDRRAYKRRNVIERLWGRLKNWRRLATRYDRLARNYLAGLALVSVVIGWI